MLTLFLPSLLLLPQEPPATKSAFEMLSLQALCHEPAACAAPVWGSLLRYVDPDERRWDLVAGVDDPPPLDPDSVARAIATIEAEATDSGVLFVEAVGDNLIAVGERTAVQRVRQLLDSATQIVARPLTVEFAAWDVADRETPAAVLDAAAYEHFVANRPPLWRALATGRPGQAIGLEHMRWTRYVRGVEAEVAQKQSQSRPATERYAQGGHAVVRAHSLVGSDEFAVHAQFAAAIRRGAVRTLQTGMPGGADLDLPTLESAFGACSGRVANGGALAATLRGNPAGGGQLVLTVRVWSRTPPVELGREGTSLLPCSALTSNALSRRIALPDPHDADGESVDGDEHAGYGHLDVDHLIDLARNVAADGDDEASVHFGAGYLLVRGSAAARRRVEALLVGLQDRTLRNVTVQHGALLQVPPPAEGETSPAVNKNLHELVMPTLPGRECVAYRLSETNVVSDVFIQIATEAGTLVPHVDPLQSGVWLRARLAPGAGALHLDLELLHVQAPAPATRAVMAGGGTLMPAEVEGVLLAHHGAVRPGTVIEHGDGAAVTVEGRSYRSSLSTTLR